jgi:hypothetical protein
MAQKKKRLDLLPANLEGWIKRFGDDFGFMELVPIGEPSSLEAGSVERKDELRSRLSKGQPLFSRKDELRSNGARIVGFEQYATDPIWTTWIGKDATGRPAKTKESCVYGMERSVCGKYTYRTWDIWNRKKPIVCFVGLFPKVDRTRKDDVRLKDISDSLGCGGYQRVNLFAYRCESNEALWNLTAGEEDSVGQWNDRVIRLAVLSSSFTVCGWGRAGELLGRSSHVLTGIKNSTSKVFCFGLTPKYFTLSGTGEKFCFPLSLEKVEIGTKLMEVPYRFVETILND